MSEPNRRHPVARVFLSIVAIVVALIIVPSAGLLIINAFDRGDPAAFLPPRPAAFVAVHSLGQTLARLSTLRAADELLSGPDEAGFRSLLVSARSSPLLASKVFRALTSVPAYAALDDDGAIAAVDLGPLLGAAVRLLPVAGPLLRIKDFSYEATGGIPRILIGKAPSFIRMASVGRILLISTSAKSIDRAIARSKASGAATVADSASAPNLAVRARLSGLELSAPTSGALRLIVDVGSLTSRLALSGPVAGAAVRELSFPGEAIVDLDIADDRITLEASLPIESKDVGLASILDRRSGVPAAGSAARLHRLRQSRFGWPPRETPADVPELPRRLGEGRVSKSGSGLPLRSRDGLRPAPLFVGGRRIRRLRACPVRKSGVLPQGRR